jgi:hypothetical protein
MNTMQMKTFRDQLVEVLQAGGYTVTDSGIGAVEEGRVDADVRVEGPEGVFEIRITGKDS